MNIHYTIDYFDDKEQERSTHEEYSSKEEAVKRFNSLLYDHNSQSVSISVGDQWTWTLLSYDNDNGLTILPDFDASDMQAIISLVDVL